MNYFKYRRKRYDKIVNSYKSNKACRCNRENHELVRSVEGYSDSCTFYYKCKLCNHTWTEWTE